MTSSNSPFGKHLRSLASRLTLWMKPKTKATEVSEVIQGMEVHTEKKPKLDVPKKTIRSPKVASAVVAKSKRAKAITPHSLPQIVQEEKKEEVEVVPVSQAISEPIAEKEAVAIGALFRVFPENKNIVGQMLEITVQNKKHSLMIRTDSLYLDSQKYIVCAGGGALGSDVELDILECKRVGGTLMLRAGAFGKDATVRWTETEAEEALEQMLKGRTGKYSTERGMFEIKRSNY